MLTIIINQDYCKKESNYIFSIIFDEFLGLKWEIEHTNCSDIIIKNEINDKQIHLPNKFFTLAESHWQNSSTMPQLPLKILDTRILGEYITQIESFIPIIYGNDEAELFIDEDTIKIPIDIFGSSFFMLSRYEEMVESKIADKHLRFPSGSSVSSKAKFLDRPIIDEYIELLWICIKKLWPDLERKHTPSRLNITCDVDSLFDLNISLFSIPRGVIGDVFKRKNLSVAKQNLMKRLSYLNGSFHRSEHYKNIQWIMDVNEQAGNSVVFYFMAGGENSLDCDYKLSSKAVRSLLREINQRGHQVGLHPSYDTVGDFIKLKEEVNYFKKIINQEGFDITQIKSRQHYLRFFANSSPFNLDSLRIFSDSTLSYADVTGFRCGTSKSFPMYDVNLRRSLDIIQVPLSVMETTVISQEYMGLGYSERALNHILKYKEMSIRISGQFTFLWHNSSFENDYAYEMYEKIIKKL
jgi:hypothetical protein